MTALATSPRPARYLPPRIPDRLKLLYVTTLHRSSTWLSEAFATDNATRVILKETVGVTAGLALLRDEVFDAVVVFHEPGVLDALDFVEALRTGGHEEPIIVLGVEPPQSFEVLAYEVGADAYCSMKQTTTRSLLWEFARAIRRYELVRENRRMVEAERQRLASEHAEAERLLEEQRTLLTELEAVDTGEVTHAEGLAGSLAEVTARSSRAALPAALVNHYRDLLQTYVVMGSGNLSDEMYRLTEVLVDAKISAHQVIALHVEVLEGMIHGLGRRSARHVMNRADLLVLEVTMHLAEGYQQRYESRRESEQQMLLPGFNEADIYAPRCEDAA
ncbi:hypothetical protein NG895_06895 [Aeoliella sp. ICT_H6.2]|uniref:Uncharacterized protein n=1 Tax=Aeoliella straminimaris TaxID=2954799 RepID=A0A9X2JF30_9BACT|nr:hypothetical protein [Aeoliella straminimaris]MCO6043630.1 hypothetical protein [Aeoliella straminimaris]